MVVITSTVIAAIAIVACMGIYCYTMYQITKLGTKERQELSSGPSVEELQKQLDENQKKEREDGQLDMFNEAIKIANEIFMEGSE